jgi:hypothetical protein
MKENRMLDVDETCNFVDNFIIDLLNGNIEIDYQRAKNLSHTLKERVFGVQKSKQTKKSFQAFLVLPCININ